MTPKEAIMGISYTILDEDAEDVIRALNDAGYVIVPREPTEAMIAASNREWDGRMSHRSSGAWKAMIDAALAE